MYWILKDKIPVKEPDLIEWAKWFQSADRIVEQTEIGDVKISTVFLGMDHGFTSGAEIFETMIFGGDDDGYTDRYATWDEAVEGHKFACQKVTSKN